MITTNLLPTVTVTWLVFVPAGLAHAFVEGDVDSLCGHASRTIKTEATPEARRCKVCTMVIERPTRAKRQRLRRTSPRKTTVDVKHITRKSLDAGWDRIGQPDPELLAQRPRCRGDCVDGERPCPWVSCKHHLFLDVNPETGSLTFNFPHKLPWELAQTCALDVADEGEHTLEDVGALLNLTRERIRQIEVRALLRKLRPALKEAA